MVSAEANAFISRRVAMSALAASRAARKKADKSPTETNLRAAYHACVWAARSLRQASIGASGNDELAMIEKSIAMDEVSYGLRSRLVRMAELG